MQIVGVYGGEKSSDALSLHPSPNIFIHNHTSLCRNGWVKMGWTSEFWLMSSEENNKLWQMWIYEFELENTQIVLGEIQRCSKQSVDIARLQMQTAGFDKCTTTQQTNLYIDSAQIQTNPWGPLLLHAYAGMSCHRDNLSYWRRWLVIIILMIKLCQNY